jgi:hypothetical protein
MTWFLVLDLYATGLGAFMGVAFGHWPTNDEGPLPWWQVACAAAIWPALIVPMIVADMRKALARWKRS